MRLLSLSLAITVMTITRVASADISAEQRKHAASAFDEGLARFKRAEYGAAANAFLLADELLANSEALQNAIAAGRRANDDLLVARAANRAIERAAADPVLAARAREALVEAEQRIARLELSCEPSPCTVGLDNEVVAPGHRYLLAGTHVLTADGDQHARATERVSFVAGGKYRVVLYPQAPTAATRAAVVTSDASAASPGPAPKASEPSPPAEPTRRTWPPVVVYVGGGATLVLAGVTAWSGLDTMSAKRALGGAPEQSALDDVHGRIRRTDVLLAGTALVGVGTAVAAFTLVDWGAARKAGFVILPQAGGAAAVAVGSF